MSRDSTLKAHQRFADAPEIGGKVGLGWFINPNPPHWLDHNGGTGAYGSFARFCPEQDCAVVVLYNRDSPDPRFVDMVGINITQLLLGQPRTPLDFISVVDKRALATRVD
jgi:CubicO group peptidase (beta-lactamase class C family)